MQFIHPDYLYFLFALIIPIVIHFFNFRRYKKVYFSNVSILKSLKKETEKESKIKHLIVLFLRLLALVMIIIAFAQPIIKKSDILITSDNTFVAIYLDNSFSMEATDDNNKSLFYLAKEKAKSILKSFPPSTKFLITSNSSNNNVFHNYSEAVADIDAIEINSSVNNLSEVYQNIKAILNKKKKSRKIVFLLSDFQKNTSHYSKIKSTDGIKINFIPFLNTNFDNLYIDSCWFQTPIQQLHATSRLWVRIRNTGNKSYEKLPLTLHINNTKKAFSGFSISKNSYTDVSLTFTNNTPGYKNATLSINDSPVTFDNKLFFSFTLQSDYNVLNIFQSEKNNSLQRLYDIDSLIHFRQQNINKIVYSDIKNNDVVILDGIENMTSGLLKALEQYNQNGGTLVIFPAKEGKSTKLNSFYKSLAGTSFTNYYDLQSAVIDVNTKHFLFDNVFEKDVNLNIFSNNNNNLPITFKYYSLKTKGNIIMQMANQLPYLVHIPSKGDIFIFAANGYESNLFQHALFVPIMYRIVLTSGKNTRLYHYVNTNENIEINSNKTPLINKTVSLKKETNNLELIPESTQLNGKTYIKVNNAETGHYKVLYKDIQQDVLAFNYDRKESQFTCWESEKLKEYANANINITVIFNSDDANNNIVDKFFFNDNKSLWQYFLILGLIFLGLESIVLRLPDYYRKKK